MANLQASAANMAVGGPFVTDSVQQWMSENPGRAAEAFKRDQDMQAFTSHKHYMKYNQGSYGVIVKRMSKKDAGIPATKSPAHNGKGRMSHCSVCHKDVHDFARHNREHHSKGPGQLWICPVVPCKPNWDTQRDGTVTIDEHLANAHHDFRHKRGHAGTLRWRMAGQGTLRHLNIAALLKVAHLSQDCMPSYVARRDNALMYMNHRFIPDPCLAALPESMISRAPVRLTKKFGRKADFISYLMELRQHFALWDDALNVADMVTLEADQAELVRPGQSEIHTVGLDGTYVMEMDETEGAMDLDLDMPMDWDFDSVMNGV